MTQGAEPFIRADAMLSGTTVIEASAGTGKTWTIEQIVLERVKAGVPMDRIVLMSFTRAAAAELSQRAYEVIRKALNEDTLADADKKSQADVRGRLQAASVIQCQPTRQGIASAIERLYSSKFQATLPQVCNPYGSGGASDKVIATIKSYPLETIVKKQFYDLPMQGISQ